MFVHTFCKYVSCIAISFIVLGDHAAFAQFTPLAGETFLATEFSGFTVEGQCSTATESQEPLHFRASGIATGPYPGTFTESGTFTMAPFGDCCGLATFEATFTIQSGTMTITGTKQTAFSGAASCGTFGDLSLLVQGHGVVSYEAQIGRRTDRGIAEVDWLYQPAFQLSRFTEQFVLSFSPTVEPALVTLEPPAATNTVGTAHTVTATVLGGGGEPAANASVYFTVVGSVNDDSMSCLTDANGQCSVTYTGPSSAGADMITAFADTNSNHIQDLGEPSGHATKAWVLPTSTPGQVTGGGQILHEYFTDGVAFGFNVRSTTAGVKGRGIVIDRITGVQIKLLA
jgi:hypothetical protein